MSKRSINTIASNPIIPKIINKSSSVEPVIDEVLSYWNYDLFTRKPGLVYSEDGVYDGTDLDLAVFLFALSDRGAVINLPEYKSIRQGTVTEGVSVVSNLNRHGKLLNVQANQETFVFSIKVFDANVTTTDTVGDYRTFALTDFDGTWHKGWKSLSFLPNAKENEFLNNSNVLRDNKIVFNSFIHPNRWVSFYGQYYFITKLLIDRLSEEAAHYNKQIQRMLSEGVAYETIEKTEYSATTKSGESKSIKVTAFKAEVDFPCDNSVFPEYQSSVENLEKLTLLRKKYIYNVIPKLRYSVRATEWAFWNHIKNNKLSSFPSWIKNITWELDYVEKGKRTKWNRIEIAEGVFIRFREYQKSETVNADYGE